MKIKDCVKGYTRGINKVIPPEQTCEVVLRKLKDLDTPILERYFEIQRPSKIPQYRVIGTDYFQQIVQAEGTNGKGHFHKQALASGLMELVERFSCYRYLRDKNVIKISSFKALKNNLFQSEDVYSNFVDAAHVRVLKDNELKTAEVRWYKGSSLNGRTVYLPMNLLGYLLAGTNGMAAGNSLEEALLHAIGEVIERHCLTLIKIKKLETPLIDPSTINSSIATELIKNLRSRKKRIFIKDFSLGIGLPVIGVVREIDEATCIITAGVASTREEALIRALTESSQSEGKINYEKISSAEHYFVNNRILSMKDIANIDNQNIRVELESIEEILKKQNMKIFFLDTKDKVLNIPSVIVYIAGAKDFVKEIACRNVLTGLIEENLETGNYREAKRYINTGKTVDSANDSIYRYFEGTILRRRHNYRRAIRYFQQVLRKVGIGEFEKLSLFQLGLCYQAEHKINKAIDCYIRIIDISLEFRIEHTQAWYKTVVLKKGSDGRLLKEARDLYRELLLARWNFANTKLIDFKKMFNKYQDDKKNICDHLAKAQNHFVSRRYKQAIREANMAMKADPMAGKMHNVYLFLGFCYEKQKLYKKAIREFQKAARIDPEDLRLIFSLSNCYRNIGHREHSKGLDKAFLKGTRDQHRVTIN